MYQIVLTPAQAKSDEFLIADLVAKLGVAANKEFLGRCHSCFCRASPMSSLRTELPDLSSRLVRHLLGQAGQTSRGQHVIKH